MFIQLDENLQYNLSWNAGEGTNSLAEAKALAGLLAFCCFLDIQAISIYGDSKTMVDDVNGKGFVSCPHLTVWMDRIMFFWSRMKGSTIQHIFRVWNQRADCLSKEGLLMESDAWSLKIFDGRESYIIQYFCFLGF